MRVGGQGSAIHHSVQFEHWAGFFGKVRGELLDQFERQRLDIEGIIHCMDGIVPPLAFLLPTDIASLVVRHSCGDVP